jgi:HK97 gp10 family phage protein
MTPAQAPEGVKQAVEKTVKSINRQVRSRGTRVKNALRNAELEVLRGQRSGKRYRKPFSTRTYTASAPGEPPARRTGALRQNWTGGVEQTSTSSKGTTVTAYIESNTPYAGYLENGTGKMAARPYVDKIKEKAQPEIERIMSEDYS